MKHTIKTYSELWDLVENDSENHKLKDITLLFLGAMNDWPTYNLDSIDEFIVQLNAFFGSALTLEPLDAKEIDFDVESNAWRAESRSQIAEMIEHSKLYYNEANFENIVSNIMSYYSKR